MLTNIDTITATLTDAGFVPEAYSVRQIADAQERAIKALRDVVANAERLLGQLESDDFNIVFHHARLHAGHAGYSNSIVTAAVESFVECQKLTTIVETLLHH